MRLSALFEHLENGISNSAYKNLNDLFNIYIEAALSMEKQTNEYENVNFITDRN